MPNTNDIFEKRLQSNIARANQAVRKIYEKAIHEITFNITSVKYKNIPFALKDYPALKKLVESTIKKMQPKIYALVVNSITESWDLSNQKNNILIDNRLQGKRPVKAARKILYDPNKRALQAFIDRKDKGINLSDRVWNTLKPLMNELEQSLGFSLANGDSAATTATQIKKYLNEPDKLFRRVRNEEGKLVLSQAARNYHPGKGVYRSSYKNALRVTRSENNIAFRTNDFNRWNSLPFVIGIEIRLSNAHPRYDICDQLMGKYPKDFIFTGWHSQCICNAIPIMASDKEFEKIEDAILNGQQIQAANIPGTIKAPPAALGKWMKANEEAVKRWKNLPYWMKDNKKFL